MYFGTIKVLKPDAVSITGFPLQVPPKVLLMLTFILLRVSLQLDNSSLHTKTVASFGILSSIHM